MQVSEVQITPVKPKDGLVAFCSFVLGESHFLGSVAIFTKLDGGIRLVFPTKLVGERQMNMHHPISHEAHERIQKAVERKYAEVFGSIS